MKRAFEVVLMSCYANVAFATEAGTIRTVPATQKDIIAVSTSLLRDTLVAVPDGEKVISVYCGDCGQDGDFVVSSSKTASRFLDIKPAKTGATTSINVVTDHNHTYTLRVTEVSGVGTPDLKLFLSPGDAGLKAEIDRGPEFVPVAELERYKQEAATAKEEAAARERSAKERTIQETEAFRTQYPKTLTFDYRFEQRHAPFNVAAIYHDDKFTYIKAEPQEIPALYEMKDGKASLMNYSYDAGLYTVQKVLDSGWLAIGKAKMNFSREGVR
jgi:type IV secretory pathway VirB9-like protein